MNIHLDKTINATQMCYAFFWRGVSKSDESFKKPNEVAFISHFAKLTLRKTHHALLFYSNIPFLLDKKMATCVPLLASD